MHIETTLVLLFAIATVVALVARRLGIPYTVALVVAGLGVGLLDLIEAPHLTKDLLFAVFLPGLIFESAYHLDLNLARRNQVAVLSLAIPGVLASILLTAVILLEAAHLADLTEQVSWNQALVFGTIVAATDPVAVLGIFRSLGAPRRLAALVEGESLLNDGTTIVFFGLVLGLVAGTATTAGAALVTFLRVVGLGIAMGFAAGYGISHLTRRIDEPMVEIMLTTLAAYGTFAAAEQLHGSGIIATVVAGAICGNYGARIGMSPTTRQAVENFWGYTAFALNSIVFLLIGFEVEAAALLQTWPVILLAFGAMLVARAGVVYAVTGIAAKTAHAIPTRWGSVLTWGGLRGAVSMVLVLSLPRDFPNRPLLIAIVFGVVLLSLLVQGLTIAPLLRWLGLSERGGHLDHALRRGELQAARVALDRLRQPQVASGLDRDILDQLEQEYRERIGRIEEELRAMHRERGGLRDAELHEARRELLMIERAEILDAIHRGTLSGEAYRRLLADIDRRLAEIDG